MYAVTVADGTPREAKKTLCVGRVLARLAPSCRSNRCNTHDCGSRFENCCASLIQHSIRTAGKYPSIFSEPLKCAHHALMNTDFWVPTRLLNFCRIQENERIITDPTLPTSSEANLGRNGELATDPANRVQDSTVLGCAKVVNLDSAVIASIGLQSHYMQHRLNTVTYIQIALALVSVTKYFETLRMIQQLPIEIEDVSVRVAFAQNRDETENQPSKTVTF